ncbi:MAG: ABC transporter substrate-binding protein [Candidatus Rokuibacteriota bacterium]|nr:MAG: ABC transporter substrate-binding protein [Candidatus Rokubacteria bacterium]
MRLIGLAVVLTLSLALPTLAAEAQETANKAHVGVLLLTPRAGAGGTYIEALRGGLRELGYVEGQNLLLEIRSAEGRPDRLPRLAAEILGTRPDVLVTAGSEAILTLKRATDVVPIIMATVMDPVALGITPSLAKPGGNLTGLAILSLELTSKRLQLLKEAFPRLSRVAVLWNPDNPGNALVLKEVEIAAQALGLRWQGFAVQRPDKLVEAFEAVVGAQCNGILAIEDSVLFSHLSRIVESAARSRLPAMYAFRQFADAGGLMSYGPNTPDSFRRAAVYVHKILKGAKPADLPIEQPTKFELVINMKTAKALGLTIPQSLLVRADEIIQ